MRTDPYSDTSTSNNMLMLKKKTQQISTFASEQLLKFMDSKYNAIVVI